MDLSYDSNTFRFADVRKPNSIPLRVLVLVVLCAVPVFTKPTWTRVSTKNGVTIYSKEVPGESVPAVRAIARLNANIHDVREVNFAPELNHE